MDRDRNLLPFETIALQNATWRLPASRDVAHFTMSCNRTNPSARVRLLTAGAGVSKFDKQDSVKNRVRYTLGTVNAVTIFIKRVKIPFGGSVEKYFTARVSKVFRPL